MPTSTESRRGMFCGLGWVYGFDRCLGRLRCMVAWEQCLCLGPGGWRWRPSLVMRHRTSVTDVRATPVWGGITLLPKVAISPAENSMSPVTVHFAALSPTVHKFSLVPPRSPESVVDQTVAGAFVLWADVVLFSFLFEDSLAWSGRKSGHTRLGLTIHKPQSAR